MNSRESATGFLIRNDVQFMEIYHDYFVLSIGSKEYHWDSRNDQLIYDGCVLVKGDAKCRKAIEDKQRTERSRT